VRVRVTPGQLEAAATALGTLATVDRPGAAEGDPWLTVHVEPGRAAEVNRVLAQQGIFASGLESGTDLELLFLELTGGAGTTSSEGTFRAIDIPEQRRGAA
jgi:hypothetical protein